MSCGSAFRQCLVGNVYGIFTSFRNFRTPFCRSLALRPVHDAVAFSYGACCERILLSGIEWLHGCETCSCILPSAGFLVICSPVCLIDHVEIRYHFIPLDISFTWKHHICSRILKHRHEIGEDEALGEHVFHRLEQAWPLPYPSSCALVEVSSMALPYRYRPVAQAFAEVHGAELLDRAIWAGRYACRVSGPDGLALEMQGRCRKILQLCLLAVDDADTVASVFFRKQLAELCPEPFRVTFSPWEISEGFGEIEIQDIASFHYALDLKLSVIYAVSFLDHRIKRVAGRLEILSDGSLGPCADAESYE